MPREISEDLKDHFAGTVLTICTCVLITLRNGTQLGITSLQEPILYDLVTYYPNGAVKASPVEYTEGIESDNLDISGMVNSDLIKLTDIKARMYTNAKVKIFRLNYEDIGQGPVVTFAGWIGNVRIVDDAIFTAELNSISSMLRNPVGRVVSANCDVRKFGDARCKVNTAVLTVSKSVHSIQSLYQLTFSSVASPDGYYDYGVVKFTSGNNAGLTRDIKRHELDSGRAVISLKSPFPFQIEAGDTALITRGCDRTPSNCEIYANQPNFRGYSHIPGTTQITKVGRGN